MFSPYTSLSYVALRSLIYSRFMRPTLDCCQQPIRHFGKMTGLGDNAHRRCKTDVGLCCAVKQRLPAEKWMHRSRGLTEGGEEKEINLPTFKWPAQWRHATSTTKQIPPSGKTWSVIPSECIIPDQHSTWQENMLECTISYKNSSFCFWGKPSRSFTDLSKFLVLNLPTTEGHLE